MFRLQVFSLKALLRLNSFQNGRQESQTLEPDPFNCEASNAL